MARNTLKRQEMELHETITTWCDVGSGEIAADRIAHPMFQFMADWMAFNAYYASRPGYSGKDAEAVRKFSRDKKHGARHLELLAKKAYSDAISAIAEHGVDDLRSRGKHHQISNAADLIEVMVCVYQIRCNLFHGGKSPNNPRDRRLVAAAHRILTELMRPFYNNPKLTWDNPSPTTSQD